MNKTHFHKNRLMENGKKESKGKAKKTNWNRQERLTCKVVCLADVSRMKLSRRGDVIFMQKGRRLGHAPTHHSKRDFFFGEVEKRMWEGEEKVV